MGASNGLCLFSPLFVLVAVTVSRVDAWTRAVGSVLFLFGEGIFPLFLLCASS